MPATILPQERATPATCEAGAPALRPADPPRSLTPPHIPVRRLPASAGSFPTIPRLKAAHRESLWPEALELALSVSMSLSLSLCRSVGLPLCRSAALSVCRPVA
jgi:hypothetical protein